MTSFSFPQKPNVYNMLYGAGCKTNTQPIPVKVTEVGHKYLTETTTNCGIGFSNKFVKPDGANW